LCRRINGCPPQRRHRKTTQHRLSRSNYFALAAVQSYGSDNLQSQIDDIEAESIPLISCSDGNRREPALTPYSVDGKKFASSILGGNRWPFTRQQSKDTVKA